jgi:predicted nuclease of predicted toxin-antitoxin system
LKGKFLVDVNLPRHFKYFHSPEFEFVSDIDTRMSDQKIWDYACAQGLIILTKDADFYTRCVLSANPAKVVHFQFGNYTLHQLHLFFEKNWTLIRETIDKSTLLIVGEDEIRAVL